MNDTEALEYLTTLYEKTDAELSAKVDQLDQRHGSYSEKANQARNQRAGKLGWLQHQIDEAERRVEVVAGITPTDHPRHVLIVEQGVAYVAPHTWPEHPDRCLAMSEAAQVFLEDGELPPPGRWWCDVDFDGNFTIGTQIEALA